MQAKLALPTDHRYNTQKGDIKNNLVTPAHNTGTSAKTKVAAQLGIEKKVGLSTLGWCTVGCLSKVSQTYVRFPPLQATDKPWVALTNNQPNTHVRKEEVNYK